MVFRYSASVREVACRRMLAGERVEEVAGDLEVSAATLYRWKRQALIDVGRKPGVKSFEPDEIETARRRIKDLEAELELVKAASALFDGKRWCAQKARPGRQRADRPGLHGEGRLSGGRDEPLNLARPEDSPPFQSRCPADAPRRHHHRTSRGVEGHVWDAADPCSSVLRTWAGREFPS